MNLERNLNINVQGNENSPVDVNILLGNSYQYNELLDQLKTQKRLFSLLPEEETAERLAISKKINELKDLLGQYERDILHLAQAFQDIEINTERLKRAKEFFDKSDFCEARIVLETELEQMRNDQTRLLKERERYENETLPKLKYNSEEFYILALSTRFDYTNPNRYAEANNYFELSIESDQSKDNIFNYAKFLREHNQLKKAEDNFNQYLNKFTDSHTPKERAMVLTHLGFLHERQNKFDIALKEYEEALKIYQNLAKENPNAFLPDVALTLNSLAGLYWTQGIYEKTLNQVEEALKIRRDLAKKNPQAFLSDLSATLNNLAILHGHQKDFENALIEYEEALAIDRNLAKNNPNTFLPSVAATLNNLGVLHYQQNEFEKALNAYEESMTIRRNLFAQTPIVYAPVLANVLINLATLYQKSLPDREKSVDYAKEAINLLRPNIQTVPYTQRYMQGAVEILRNWEINDEEINNLIGER